MALAAQFLEDLEAKITHAPSGERVSILRAVTDLFLNGASQFSEEQVEVFDDVLCHLIEHIEARVLAELSRDLAPVAWAPRQVIGRLARNDDIEVSHPVLRHSPRLTTEDLVEIAATKSQAHLGAIAGRASVEPPVSDILVARGDARVARMVAGNAGAQFSQKGYTQLVNRAEKEEGLTELVAFRPDLSPEHLRHLVTKATDTVRQRLVTTAPLEIRPRIESVLAEVAAKIDIETAEPEPSRDYEPARRFVLPLQSDAAAMKTALRECAEAGKIEYAIVLLATLSAIPVPLVERVLTRGHHAGVLILCRAIDVDWPVVTALLSLRDESGQASALPSETFFDQFRKLTVSTARRVVRFWRIRASVGGADETADLQ